MAGVTMYFHNQVHNKLKPYIRYYWYTIGFIDNDPGQQLLPMDHTDLIVQCSGSFAYLINGEMIRTEDVVFHGLRKEPIKVFKVTIVKLLVLVLNLGFIPLFRQVWINTQTM